MRGKDYDLLDLPEIQARLALPPDQETTHPESGTSRALFDCPHVLLTPTGPRTRLIVATHPATAAKAPIGVTRDGVVSELFYTTLPQDAFTPADVLALYLHRGAFETVLCDEDQEQGPDRWCSRTACGQECWQVINQWMWNLRLELGHRLHPTSMRITEFAPVQAVSLPPPQPVCEQPAPVAYGPPQWARAAQMGGFAGEVFTPQPDGTLRCPTGFPLYPQERRPERDGSLRVVYAARIGHCRPCPLREECQGYGTATKKPRRISAVLWPVEGPRPEPTVPLASPPTSHPILWGDWERRAHRRELVKLLRHQRVDIQLADASPPTHSSPVRHFSRAERAHYRLSWAQRLARNVRTEVLPSISITVFGLPESFAASIGLHTF